MDIPDSKRVINNKKKMSILDKQKMNVKLRRFNPNPIFD